ncbi:MAG: band 7 protein, partial [bacterium (Candidatus Stahlbacteria) CG23_combo_of_CG06-09_8_20_14_all_40_9]
EFVLKKAEKQAEVKVVEAKGIAQAQRIINRTLTVKYLQHEAIEAYKALAGSPNTTFIIMPTSPEGAGIPLIIGK